MYFSDSTIELCSLLLDLNIEMTIRENKFGKTASIASFKTKEEFIRFIIKRINDRYHKGDSFGRVSPEKVS